MTRTRKNLEEIKQLALDVIEGRMFGSWQVRDSDTHLMGQIFLPLLFLDSKQHEQLKADQIVHVVGDMSETMFHSLNGYPVFTSIAVLDQEEATQLKQQMEILTEMRRQFLGETHE